MPALTRWLPCSLPSFLFEQIILMQPLTLLIWGTGLISLLVHPGFRQVPFLLGWCYLAVLAVIVFPREENRTTSTPIIRLLFVAGAIAIERWLTRRWMRIAIVTVILVVGNLTAPLGMPLLPVGDLHHIFKRHRITPFKRRAVC